MAAAAYKVSMAVQTSSGNKTLFLTASDVNAAAWVFPSGGTEIQLDSSAAVIRDIILGPTYGTDTTTVSVFVNGVDTGMRIINSANQSGTYNRQILTTPIGIKPGALVKFVQNT
jgi:hypothetical protein